MQEAAESWDRNAKLSSKRPSELTLFTRAVPVDVGVDARTYQVLVTSTSGPASFYVRLFDNELAYDKMRKVMADNYIDSVTKTSEGAATSQTEHWMKSMPLEDIEVEGLYVAWMETQSDWHRVVVKAKIQQENSVSVLFIDHGDVDVLPANRLRRITPDLVDPQQSPVFALLCSLYGCNSPESEQEAAVLFNEMVLISHKGVSQARKLTVITLFSLSLLSHRLMCCSFRRGLSAR